MSERSSYIVTPSAATPAVSQVTVSGGSGRVTTEGVELSMTEREAADLRAAGYQLKPAKPSTKSNPLAGPNTKARKAPSQAPSEAPSTGDKETA